MKFLETMINSQPAGVVSPGAAPQGIAKEPWQMTQDEFEKDLLQDYNETAKRLKLPLKIDIGESTMHKWIIEQALSEGKPVPPEVLRDYPELAATMPAAAPRMTVAPAEVAKPTPPTAEAPVTPEVTPVTKAVTPVSYDVHSVNLCISKEKPH